MNGNRRRFIGASGVALAAAALGLGQAQSQSATTATPPLAFEGNMPALDAATAWLNSAPLTPADLRQKIVVVQFWTFTCVNWLRTLPYVRAWTGRYSAKGLVVIGVHTPEFSFEHNIDNVQQAANSMQVAHPIAIDNDYAIWDGFANQYWPALYIVDASGHIRYHHFGEGAYEESERVIQQLLTDSGVSGTDPEPVSVEPRGAEVAADWSDLQSSETYLGSARAQSFGSPGGVVPGSSHVYAAPDQLMLNQWALTGDWTFGTEAVVLNKPNGRLAYQFHARDLNLVMGPTTPGASSGFRVLIDGQAPGAAHGFDVDQRGDGTLSEQRLYQLIRQPQPVSERRFEIEFLDPGAAAYDFTFG